VSRIEQRREADDGDPWRALSHEPDCGELRSAGQHERAPLAVDRGGTSVRRRAGDGERAAAGQTGLLDDVASALPALMRAEKLQRRASSVGFDWNNAHLVLEKIAEEAREVLDATTQGQREEEIGKIAVRHTAFHDRREGFRGLLGAQGLAASNRIEEKPEIVPLDTFLKLAASNKTYETRYKDAKPAGKAWDAQTQ